VNLGRIVVVYKRSIFEQMSRKISPKSVKPLRTAHDNNARCLETVQEVLHGQGIAHEFRERNDFEGLKKADLVIAVGGDGTFLSAATHVGATPMLGVNSNPPHSVGYFCAATAKTFGTVLEKVLAGKARTTKVVRMRLTLGGKVISRRILNDVLVASSNPAATSRYTIRAQGKSEAHRSSGVWVATPAGSTAGIRAAGGKTLPLTSQRLQFLVREPFTPEDSTYDLTRGFISGRQKLFIESRMEGGSLFVDGPRNVLDFQTGACATFDVGGEPLSVLSLNPVRGKRWK